MEDGINQLGNKTRIFQPRHKASERVSCSKVTLPHEYRFRHNSFPIFPPPFLASTSLFLRKLEEDNICL
jgi:hypothetical protein